MDNNSKTGNSEDYRDEVIEFYLDKYGEMNKGSMASYISDQHDLPRDDVNKIIGHFMEAVKEFVSRGQRVVLRDFCVFERVIHAERKCPNPRTGKMMTVPEAFYPKVKFGTDFKERVTKVPIEYEED